MACTGQVGIYVACRVMECPCLNGSIFDCLRSIVTVVGVSWMLVQSDEVNSLALRNPRSLVKRQIIAGISQLESKMNHSAVGFLKLLIILIVMGKHCLEVSSCALLIPVHSKHSSSSLV